MAADGRAPTGAFVDPLRSPQIDGIREWGTVDDLIRQFHFTVAPELYHIGCGAERLPGGPTWERFDAPEGRVRLDALTLRRTDGSLHVLEAESARLLGSVSVVADAWASGGKTVTDVDVALGNGVEFALALPAPCTAYIRYASVGGAVLGGGVGDEPIQRVELPATGNWSHYGDHPLALPTGPCRLRLERPTPDPALQRARLRPRLDPAHRLERCAARDIVPVDAGRPRPGHTDRHHRSHYQAGAPAPGPLCPCRQWEIAMTGDWIWSDNDSDAHGLFGSTGGAHAWRWRWAEWNLMSAEDICSQIDNA